MCDCGCGTCSTQKPVVLNENLAPKAILSEGLKYHMDNARPLTEHVYRAGSENYFNLWAEARALYTRGILEVTDNDLEVLTETDLGHFGMFEGKKVPLDFPIELTETELNEMDNMSMNEVTRYSGFNRNPEDPDSIPFEPTGSVSEFKEELRALFGKFKGDLKNPEFIKGVAQIMVNWKPLLRSQLAEAKKKKKKAKKDPPIGKPKRGGSKAYYVYVRNPKTKKVKKVSFGSGGLRAKIRNPKARKAFAARHNCKNKKDRTKAGYWACNLPRYASQLGLGANMNTFW